MLAPASSFHTEWIAFERLESQRAEWSALCARALEPNVFYEPAFLLPAARMFAPRAGAILIRDRAGRLTGLFPMRDARRGLVHSYAPLGTPPVDRDTAEETVAAFLQHLAHGGQRTLLLPLLAGDGPFAAALTRVLSDRKLRQRQFGAHRRALLLAGDNPETIHAAGARKDRRRQLRRLEERGPLRHWTVTEPAAIARATEIFLALEMKGWKGRAGTAAVQDDRLRTFFTAAVTQLADAGQMRIDVLSCAEIPVAATIVLTSGNTAWLWKIAYDEDFARFSPGVHLTLDVSRSLLADAGIARTDSCATPGHPMIDRLWPGRLAVSDRLIALRPGDDIAFEIACAAESAGRAAFATLRALRNAVRRGRFRRARAAACG